MTTVRSVELISLSKDDDPRIEPDACEIHQRVAASVQEKLVEYALSTPNRPARVSVVGHRAHAAAGNCDAHRTTVTAAKTTKSARSARGDGDDGRDAIAAVTAAMKPAVYNAVRFLSRGACAIHIDVRPCQWIAPPDDDIVVFVLTMDEASPASSGAQTILSPVRIYFEGRGEVTVLTSKTARRESI